ncbi:class I SAM-dependent methyltransferase [Actinocatenispora rupis]
MAGTVGSVAGRGVPHHAGSSFAGMDTDEWNANRLSFGPAADLYDRIRPTYPPAAVSWALGEAPLRVVDLGAGTGKLTRLLAAAGHDVVAVEPDEGMLARLSAVLPGVSAHVGSAESVPVPDASVDAVVAGQAYHWFDRERAHPEIARVLRPGGVFVPIWNRRDEDVPWVAALTAILGEHDGSTEASAPTLPAELFGPVEAAEFGHTTPMTADGLVDLVRSRSYYLTATPEHRAELEGGVRELCSTHPQLRGRAEFELPYRTFVYRAARR